MADMKKLVIDGVEYEIIDASVRIRMTDAESDIAGLQTGKADNEDVPTNTSDLNNDAGFITEVPVEDVTIDGSSVVSGKIAAIPRATDTRAGAVKIDPHTAADAQYLDIYAEKENGAEKENRVPLLDANNKILAAQLPAATTSTQGAMSAADKEKVNGLTAALDGKVDKVTGKGLSTNDYTTEEKDKLAGLAAEGIRTYTHTLRNDIAPGSRYIFSIGPFENEQPVSVNEIKIESAFATTLVPSTWYCDTTNGEKNGILRVGFVNVGAYNVSLGEEITVVYTYVNT